MTELGGRRCAGGEDRQNVGGQARGYCVYF